MEYFYDHETDSLSITVGDFERYEESEEVAPGVILHSDSRRRPIGVEIRKAKMIIAVRGLQSFESHRITGAELSQRMLDSASGRVVMRALEVA
jgi:uncharacterized protein YuzE